VETVKIVSEDAIFNKIAEENERNIVLVCGLNDDGHVAISQTGFVAGKNGYILTAFHLFANPETKRVVIRIRKGNLIEIRESKGMTPLPQYDMALVKIDYQFETAVRTKARTLRSGEPLFSMGYARVEMSRFSHKTPLKKAYGRFYIYDNEISVPMGRDMRMQLSTLHTTFGASGSPVFDASGNVVGLLSLVQPVERSLQVYTWSAPITYYERFLKIFQK